MFAEDLARYRKEIEAAVPEDDVNYLRHKARFKQAVKFHFAG
jgi:hypothetical protein